MFHHNFVRACALATRCSAHLYSGSHLALEISVRLDGMLLLHMICMSFNVLQQSQTCIKMSIIACLDQHMIFDTNNRNVQPNTLCILFVNQIYKNEIQLMEKTIIYIYIYIYAIHGTYFYKRFRVAKGIAGRPFERLNSRPHDRTIDQSKIQARYRAMMNTCVAYKQWMLTNLIYTCGVHMCCCVHAIAISHCMYMIIFTWRRNVHTNNNRQTIM